MKSLLTLLSLFICLFFFDSITAKRAKRVRNQKKQPVQQPVQQAARKPLFSKLSRQPKKKLYQLKVDGVECKICAHTVVKKLGNVSTVENPQYYQIEDDFGKSFAEVTMLPEDFSINQLQKAIETKGNEYVIEMVHGEFLGSLTQHNGKWVFQIPALELTLAPRVVPQRIKQKIKRRRSGAFLPYTGTIYLKDHQFVFD